VQQAVPELRSSQSKEESDAGGVTPAPTTEAGTTPSQPDDYADLSDDPGADELTAYRAGARRRVEKLVRQRNEARAALQTHQTELEQLRGSIPQAQAAASVQKYLADNDIGKDDFLLTLELAAAMRRGDFKTFYEGVRPYVQLAEEYLGISLPQDLRQRVAEGHMTAPAAAMFHRERMDRALSESQRVRQAQAYDAHVQSTAQQNLNVAVRDTVNAWEQTTMRSDPDYVVKKPLLEQVMWAVVRERGNPQSPEHAVEIAKEAYKRVNELSARWRPPKAPTSRQPSSTGRTNGAAPEPKSLKDAVLQAIDRARV